MSRSRCFGLWAHGLVSWHCYSWSAWLRLHRRVAIVKPCTNILVLVPCESIDMPSSTRIPFTGTAEQAQRVSHFNRHLLFVCEYIRCRINPLVILCRIPCAGQRDLGTVPALIYVLRLVIPLTGCWLGKVDFESTRHCSRSRASIDRWW
jgi:hypothetical protein